MKIVYVDMDGVLADFDTGLKLVEQKIKEEYSPKAHDLLEYKGRFDEIPGLFSILPPIEGAISSIRKLDNAHSDEGNKLFDVYILSSAPWGNPSAWIDKLLWVKKYLPEFKKRLILSHNKHLNIGDYLIDDRKKNGSEKFTGEHIHFGQEPFPNWKTVLEYLL